MNAHTMPELFERRSPLSGKSWDSATWSFTAVLAVANVAVRRLDTRGEYDEIVSLDQSWPQHIPLLDTHRSGSVADQLGSVKDLRVVGGELLGTVTLSRHNTHSQRIAADVEAGHFFGFSIGYSVLKWVEQSDPSTGRRVKVAASIELRECSICPVPADPNTGIRSASEMTVENQPAPAPVTTPAATPETQQPATVDRAAFNTEVRSLGRSLGLPSTWVDAQIDSAPSIEAVRSAALDAMVQRSSTVTTVHVGVDHSDPIAIRTAMADALAYRIAPAHIKVEGRAREFAGHSMLDMVADLAHARGDRVNQRDKNALMERAVGAHSTSDFPLLLADSANKALLAQYQVAAPTYRKWAARKSFTDFKEHQFLRAGDMPAFQEIRENGEVRYGGISENAEKVSAKEYGTGITIGRRALINDDMSALSDFSTAIATRAAADENRLAYGVLKANGALSDGVALFHASHANLPTAVAFGAAGIAAAVKALRAQKSLDGLQLNLQPALLVVGPDLEVAARQLLAAVNATKSGDVNVWANFADLVVDGNLGATEYYIFASPAAAPVAAYGYVQGAEGPVIRSERDFDTQAIKVAASLDFGVGIIDHRGAVKNAGA